YPTSLRANGSGWELGIGRIGSIVGPLVGAIFVGLPVQTLYIWAALPFAIGAVICFIIHRLNTARLCAHPELPEAQEPNSAGIVITCAGARFHRGRRLGAAGSDARMSNLIMGNARTPLTDRGGIENAARIP